MAGEPKDKEPNGINSQGDRTIIGISVISSLINTVSSIHDPEKILHIFQQIIFFYKLLPNKWRRIAYKLSQNLWNRKKIVISTDPEGPSPIYDARFHDDRINNLLKLLSPNDVAIFYQGKAMLDLISKGLHAGSDEIKSNVEETDGKRGLNIVNMITTGDIEYMLEENEGLPDDKMIRNFEFWAREYQKIAICISPRLVNAEKIIENYIQGLASNSLRKYILVNISSGRIEDVTKILNIINNMKGKNLIFKNIDHKINDSGLCKTLNAKINF